MAGQVETPGCVHHIHVRTREEIEPSRVCSCPGGLIHMHDCPPMMGLPCIHFTAQEGPPGGLPPLEFEPLLGRLTDDYLTRSYFHRIRGLGPGGDPWLARRRDRDAEYAEAGEVGDLPSTTDEDYEREKERLIEQRKRREAARLEREARSREERAQERARHGIKTVVERAQETVAAQGNVASSIVDDVKLPRERRRRRRRKGGPPSADAAPAQGDAGPGKKKRRRRRRRRRPRGSGGESGS